MKIAKRVTGLLVAALLALMVGLVVVSAVQAADSVPAASALVSPDGCLREMRAGFYFFNSPVRRTAPVKFPPWARLNNFSIFPKYINSASANREAFTARYAIRQ